MINQIELFEFILRCHPTKTAAYTAIGDRMNVTVYKAKDWARGKTSITYPDLSALIRNFNISPYDLFLEEPDKIGFNYINLDANDPDNYLRYITSLAVQL